MCGTLYTNLLKIGIIILHISIIIYKSYCSWDTVMRPHYIVSVVASSPFQRRILFLWTFSTLWVEIPWVLSIAFISSIFFKVLLFVGKELLMSFQRIHMSPTVILGQAGQRFSTGSPGCNFASAFRFWGPPVLFQWYLGSFGTKFINARKTLWFQGLNWNQVPIPQLSIIFLDLYYIIIKIILFPLL